ncbi:hypothetical protein RRG08_017140 [Elysia crispata]|uniref:Uncharacterized protein n=1 Tax=Elysia crispata TaxID=231223 RepID=A0AAE1DD11_9GAST|nr:hypothetical protein RRG08_017140 [Elysia crispata]
MCPGQVRSKPGVDWQSSSGALDKGGSGAHRSRRLALIGYSLSSFLSLNSLARGDLDKQTVKKRTVLQPHDKSSGKTLTNFFVITRMLCDVDLGYFPVVARH